MREEGSGSWDVDKYKTEHESDEHWELRRKFLITHQDTLPEDELVCMAQVFTNVEFLGCRYPDETMIRVAELAKGVVEEFREKKKNTLKRTFVAASDAASSKVKGLGKRINNREGDLTAAKRPMTFVASIDNSNQVPPIRLEPTSGPFGRLVVVIMPHSTNIQNTLQNTLNSNQETSKFVTTLVTTKNEILTKTTCLIRGEEFASAVAVDQKTSKELAATQAMEKLRKMCYTLVLKNRFAGQSVNKSDIGTEDSKPSPNISQPDDKIEIGDDNVGSKLMRLMGWTGGGLGSTAQGRVEPVKATTTVGRAGIGLDPKTDDKTFRSAANKYLLEWFRQSSKELVFASDFTKDQRKIIHEVARRQGLKSQSFGKDANRQLVISRKCTLWNIVEEIAREGGISDKYQLLPPGAPWSLDECNLPLI